MSQLPLARIRQFIILEFTFDKTMLCAISRLLHQHGPYWLLSADGRNRLLQDGDNHRNPSFIYNVSILDAGFAVL